jgi:ribosomal protein S18 acetylase RimI-like enzyme
MIQVRLMTTADLPVALGLCRQAGWNQTAADWQRFLDLQPDGCFVAEWDGAPVGTTTTSIFGSVAWIAMVLVDEAFRGRGIGRALVSQALNFLDQRGVATVRLDATPLGRSLYERLGFVEQFQLARYEGTLAAGASRSEVDAVLPEHLEALTALDQAITGTDRRRLLLRLFAEEPRSLRCVWHGGRPMGFMASRSGHRAVQLGPCIAAPEVGAALFADALQRLAGQRIFLDVPTPNAAATRLAEACGLGAQRQLTRMCRGVAVFERIDWLWASSGPEKG